MTLKEYRRKKSLTMAQLAALIGCCAASIYKYEQGTMPRDKMCERISKITNGWVKRKDFC